MTAVEGGWMKRLDRAALTFDLDWAPDWCISLCVEICSKYGVPATFFVTHDTPLLQILRTNPLFELGIHPNFLPGSSHGSSHREVVEFCVQLIPEAHAMRTHALVQSSHIFAMVADFFPQIDTDVSLLLPFHVPGLQPTDIYFGKSKRRITRLPYFWEDDDFAETPGRDWASRPPSASDPGLRIFDFHPVYVALNMASMQGYQLVKSELGARPLFSATPEEFRPHINEGLGCRKFLEALLMQSDLKRFCKISDITTEYRRLGR